MMPHLNYSLSFPVMRALDASYLRFNDLSNAAAPRGGAIPIGGGDWMDNFFKAEALRVFLSHLRRGETVLDAMTHGILDCHAAINLWNRRREWQVHRSNDWVMPFLQEQLTAAHRNAWRFTQ